MLKQIRVCDRCGGECQWDTIYAVVGDQRLPTGEQEDVCEPVDLCNACLSWAVRGLVARLSHVTAGAWVKLARTPQKPVRM